MCMDIFYIQLCMFMNTYRSTYLCVFIHIYTHAWKIFYWEAKTNCFESFNVNGIIKKHFKFLAMKSHSKRVIKMHSFLKKKWKYFTSWKKSDDLHFFEVKIHSKKNENRHSFSRSKIFLRIFTIM